MTSTQRVSEFGESELIARIGRFLTMTADVELGPGDDAAIIRAADGRFVVSTDVLVEGRHFLANWISPFDLGQRALAQNLADIAAMGARPTGIVVALTLPGDIEVTWLDELARGMGEFAATSGAAVAGGDLVRGATITIAVTVMGSLDGAAPVLRSGAQPGHVVGHAGRVGWSAAGLALLQDRTDTPERPFQDARGGAGDEFVAAHRVPQPPLEAGIAARKAGASSMLDVSDGLLRDAGRIAGASGVVLDLDEPALRRWQEPLDPVATHVGADAWHWVLAGGEDHGLLATFPPTSELPEPFTKIGLVKAAPEAPGVVISGQPVQLPPGWDHFAG